MTLKSAAHEWTEATEGDVMLITQNRIALSTAIGLPATRIFGAMTVYVSRDCPIELAIEDAQPQLVDFAVVPPHTRHRATTRDGCIAKVLVESEAIDVSSTMDLLSMGGNRDGRVACRMRSAFARLRESAPHEFDVDHTFFGFELPRKSIDTRIEKVLSLINENPGADFSANDCADFVGLSFGRFLHLFRAETGSTFRGYLGWRHARDFMPFVNGPYNLLDVAMQLGYADAPHFSRSIRQYYGITPSQISSVSRKLRVLIQHESGQDSSARNCQSNIRLKPKKVDSSFE